MQLGLRDARGVGAGGLGGAALAFVGQLIRQQPPPNGLGAREVPLLQEPCECPLSWGLVWDFICSEAGAHSNFVLALFLCLLLLLAALRGGLHITFVVGPPRSSLDRQARVSAYYANTAS